VCESFPGGRYLQRIGGSSCRADQVRPPRPENPRPAAVQKWASLVGNGGAPYRYVLRNGVPERYRIATLSGESVSIWQTVS
jgi:hypothetical protein